MTRLDWVAAITLTGILIAGCSGQGDLPPVTVPFGSGHTKILAEELSNTSFGGAVAAHGDEVLVAAPGELDLSGAAYIMARDGSGWTRTAKLTASNGYPGQAFGLTVAFDGVHAVVGTMADSTKGTSAGAVYVFEREGDGWREAANLTASDGADFNFFGTSVGISGNYLIVGAPGHTDGTGAAYLFELVGGTWTETEILTLDTPESGDSFGNAVAIDGTRALIAASRDDRSATDAGAVYVYERSGTTWLETATLTASDALAGDSLGGSVALAGDQVVVGAPARDDDGTSSGAAYVFRKSGDAWLQVAKLVASDAAQMDVFGYSVDLAGPYVAVGAPSLDLADVLVPGAAYIYTETDGVWSEVARLAAQDGSPDERFGYDLDLTDDFVAIGTPRALEQDLLVGAVYVFEK